LKSKNKKKQKKLSSFFSNEREFGAIIDFFSFDLFEKNAIDGDNDLLGVEPNKS